MCSHEMYQSLNIITILLSLFLLHIAHGMCKYEYEAHSENYTLDASTTENDIRMKMWDKCHINRSSI